MIPGLSISSARLMLRAANEFTLDVFGIVRDGRDFTDALLLMALAQGAGASLSSDPARLLEFASFGAPPAAGICRSISVSAIASSLGLPFETVRRRVKALEQEGYCAVTPAGVRLSYEYLTSQAHREVLERTHQAARHFYRRLRRAHCLPPPVTSTPPAPAALGAEAAPVRLVWRVVAEYILRLMEFLLPNYPSPAVAFVILAVVRENTRFLSDDVRGEDGLDAESFVDDALRRPARTSQIANLLGLPPETVRRHLGRLVEDGRCRRVGGRFIVPAEVLARPNLFAALAANASNFGRLLSTLSVTGVLDRWEADFEAELVGLKPGLDQRPAGWGKPPRA